MRLKGLAVKPRQFWCRRRDGVTVVVRSVYYLGDRAWVVWNRVSNEKRRTPQRTSAYHFLRAYERVHTPFDMEP